MRAGGGAPLPPACSALTGALAAACFVKAFGVAFLGLPRSEQAAHAQRGAAGCCARACCCWRSAAWRSGCCPDWRTTLLRHSDGATGRRRPVRRRPGSARAGDARGWTCSVDPAWRRARHRRPGISGDATCSGRRLPFGWSRPGPAVTRSRRGCNTAAPPSPSPFASFSAQSCDPSAPSRPSTTWRPSSRPVCGPTVRSSRSSSSDCTDPSSRFCCARLSAARELQSGSLRLYLAYILATLRGAAGADSMNDLPVTDRCRIWAPPSCRRCSSLLLAPALQGWIKRCKGGLAGSPRPAAAPGVRGPGQAAAQAEPAARTELVGVPRCAVDRTRRDARGRHARPAA